MKNDFNDFISPKASQETTPEIDQKVLSFIKSELDPESKTVFMKLVLVQAFIGLTTMLFCPQFNFSLTNNYDLFHYFHKTFGHQVCMIICGCIFLGSGAIFAASILKEGEIRKIQQSKWLAYPALSILTIGIFMLAGAKIYLNLVAFWMIGAIGGGLIFFELTILTNHYMFGGSVGSTAQKN